MTRLFKKKPKCPSCHSKFIVFSDVWNKDICGECGSDIKNPNNRGDS